MFFCILKARRIAMRKKPIWSNSIKNEGVLYHASEIKPLHGTLEGYVGVLSFLPGTRELYVVDDERRVCLCAKGYRWLMYLPAKGDWCLTAFYDCGGRLLEWYFDISNGNFLDEDGIPCSDDLFLDLVILPDGTPVTLDEDELKEALEQGIIDFDAYHTAYRIRDEILNNKWSDTTWLSQLSPQLVSLFE